MCLDLTKGNLWHQPFYPVTLIPPNGQGSCLASAKGSAWQEKYRDNLKTWEPRQGVLRAGLLVVEQTWPPKAIPKDSSWVTSYHKHLLNTHWIQEVVAAASHSSTQFCQKRPRWRGASFPKETLTPSNSARVGTDHHGLGILRLYVLSPFLLEKHTKELEWNLSGICFKISQQEKWEGEYTKQ